MSDQNSNLDHTSEAQVHQQAESQTAAAGAPQQPQGGAQAAANPLANIDVQKLIGLLKNPTASVRLQPAVDWIYGVIGAAIGVLGFFFFVWALKNETTPDVDAGDLDGLFSALSSITTAWDSPFFSLFGSLKSGEYLIVAVCAIVLAGVAFTLVGNWIGGRKRTWTEAATYYGGTQLMFGVGLFVSGIIAFISVELASFLGALLLVVSLLVLVIQALALHEVTRDRVFPYIYQSIGGFGIALYLVYLIFH
ncbi:hypothetical protein [Cohnella yongneupensis]|uniref:Yip1 domain-containing protein n=1 Tax=Cohnella yongneupensis TaxID=425006 RepID=A0ABW0R5Z9_9BACL